jgi:hypothetical protein
LEDRGQRRDLSVPQPKKPTTLLSTLKPILIHMCGTDSPIKQEHEDVLEAVRKIWQISKTDRSDRGSNLEDSIEQIGIGGTPTRKQPLSPWQQVASPVTLAASTTLSKASVKPGTSPPILGSSDAHRGVLDASCQRGDMVRSQSPDLDLPIGFNSNELNFSDRLARDIDMPSESLDIFARNVMFTPLPLEGKSAHETCVTSIDVSNIWSVRGYLRQCERH